MFVGMQETLDVISTVADTVYVSDADTVRRIQCIQPS